METQKKSTDEKHLQIPGLLNEIKIRKHYYSRSNYSIRQNEIINLLCKKIGITEDELKLVNTASLEYARSMAAKYENKIKETDLQIKTAIQKSFNHSNGFTLYIGDAPFPSLGTPGDFYPFPGPYQHGSIRAEGIGDGIISGLYGGFDGENQVVVNFELTFRPKKDGFYIIQAPLFAAGQYYLIADDGALNSKEATCDISCDMYLRQSLTNEMFNPQYQYFTQPEGFDPNPFTTLPYVIFTDGGQNINKYDTFLAVKTFDLIPYGFSNKHPIWLFANHEVKITIYCRLEVHARGEGSIAAVYFDEGGEGRVGGTIYSPGVTVFSV